MVSLVGERDGTDSLPGEIGQVKQFTPLVLQ